MRVCGQLASWQAHFSLPTANWPLSRMDTGFSVGKVLPTESSWQKMGSSWQRFCQLDFAS
jgi:hypothetical protein